MEGEIRRGPLFSLSAYARPPSSTVMQITGLLVLWAATKNPRLPERPGLVDHDAFCCSDAPQKISDRGRLHRAHQIGDGLLTALVIESVRAAYSSLCRTASLELTAVWYEG